MGETRMFTNIKEALTYIEAQRNKRSFTQFLETVQTYHFDAKQKNMIHIAGTNGKGSTVTYLKDILVGHGYRVGTFTSPYMICHNDRICINGVPISDTELLDAINRMLPIIQKEKLSMFEIDVLIMLDYFSKQDLDYRIIETGIGGKEDKTNVIASKISAITNIGYDHQFMLGDTLESIASHKAGIIKPHQHFFTTEQNPVLLERFNEVCKKQESHMHVVQPLDTLQDAPSYQRYNAALAKAIAKQCIKVNPSILKQAFIDFHWPGRFEQFDNIYLDGAHNIDGIKALLQTIKEKQFTNVVIIFSALQDKDFEVMKALLNEYPIMEVSFDDERVANRQAMAFPQALALAKQRYDTIIVTGSLHFISAVRKFIITT